MYGLAAKLRQVALIDLPGSPGFSQVTMAAVGSCQALVPTTTLFNVPPKLLRPMALA